MAGQRQGMRYLLLGIHVVMGLGADGGRGSLVHVGGPSGGRIT